MCYPYDGIRSGIDYYNRRIEYLEQEIKRLKELNDEYLKLIAKYNIPIKEKQKEKVLK